MEEINWYSKKIGKTVEEFDMFDKYITDVLKEFVKEQKEAINYTHSCKSDSELLLRDCSTCGTYDIADCNNCLSKV